MNNNNIECICGKIFEIKIFKNHFRKCKEFIHKFKKFDYYMIIFIKEYLKDKKYIILLKFLLRRYIKLLDIKIKEFTNTINNNINIIETIVNTKTPRSNETTNNYTLDSKNIKDKTDENNYSFLFDQVFNNNKNNITDIKNNDNFNNNYSSNISNYGINQSKINYNIEKNNNLYIDINNENKSNINTFSKNFTFKDNKHTDKNFKNTNLNFIPHNTFNNNDNKNINIFNNISYNNYEIPHMKNELLNNNIEKSKILNFKNNPINQIKINEKSNNFNNNNIKIKNSVLERRKNMGLIQKSIRKLDENDF